MVDDKGCRPVDLDTIFVGTCSRGSRSGSIAVPDRSLARARSVADSPQPRTTTRTAWKRSPTARWRATISSRQLCVRRRPAEGSALAGVPLLLTRGRLPSPAASPPVTRPLPLAPRRSEWASPSTATQAPGSATRPWPSRACSPSTSSRTRTALAAKRSADSASSPSAWRARSFSTCACWVRARAETDCHRSRLQRCCSWNC